MKRGRVSAGPWIGLRDSLDATISNDPQFARMIQNMYPLELDKPSTFVGRPGFDQAGSQLGAVAKRVGQLVTQFTKLAGTEYTAAVVGGQGIDTYDWVTETWTKAVSVANLATASVTLSETAHAYSNTFTDTLLLSDGVNKPFTWTGASGAGGLTSLTNAPVIYGQPTVYYAKVFGIKSTERSTIVWSEENSANTGYEAGGYANAWTLGQTDQEPLYAVVGTNEAIYYFRARSIGAIRGAVTQDFQNDGTREGVDENIGTISPDGIAVVGDRIFFIDADARPHVLEGGRVRPLFDDIRETIRGLDRAQLATAVTRYDPTTGLVMFGVAEVGQSNPSVLLTYNPVLNVCASIWRGYTFQALGMVKNATAIPVLMHLASDGYAYDHGSTSGTLWDDELNSGTLAIAHALETCHLAVDARYEKHFQRADILFRAEEDATAINVKHFTPYGASTAVSGSVSSNEPRYDVATSLYDVSVYGTGVTERKLAVGMRAIGRWVRLRIDHQVAGEEFGVEQVTADYTPAGDHREAA